MQLHAIAPDNSWAPHSPLHYSYFIIYYKVCSIYIMQIHFATFGCSTNATCLCTQVNKNGGGMDVSQVLSLALFNRNHVQTDISQVESLKH